MPREESTDTGDEGTKRTAARMRSSLRLTLPEPHKGRSAELPTQSFVEVFDVALRRTGATSQVFRSLKPRITPYSADRIPKKTA